MIDGGVEIMELPAISGFLEELSAHVGKWGFYPGAKGEVLTKEMAQKVPGSERWIGSRVFDANGLVEAYTGIPKDGDAPARIKLQYEEWCYGHVGEVIEELVELPGAAVFKTDQDGAFMDVAYLYRKNGEGKLDWDIFVCNSPQKGLCLEKLDASWNCWGLISMILRYDVNGPVTKGLCSLPLKTPYAVVGSSVLNFREEPTGKLITSLPNSTVVELTGRTLGDWTEVLVGDIRGYVFSRFLEKHPEG